MLSSENRQDYEELLISLLEAYWPMNFLGERLIKYLADEEWEVARYKRHKIFLIERRFQARLGYQAYREKAAQEHKAALAKTLAEHQAAPLRLLEEALEGLIAEVDAMLLRPAQELDHARALEVGIVYFQHLDRLLNAAIARRNRLRAFWLCQSLDHPFMEREKSSAENGFVLRCVQAERIAAIERHRDATATPLATGDLGFARAKATLARAKLTYAMAG